jgi:hypothetical protein
VGLMMSRRAEIFSSDTEIIRFKVNGFPVKSPTRAWCEAFSQGRMTFVISLSIRF